MTSHLYTLKAMCLNADILGKVEQREALGWALARINEFRGTKVADALEGKPSDEIITEMQSMQDKIDELENFIDYICYLSKKDRRQMENTYRWRNSLRGR